MNQESRLSTDASLAVLVIRLGIGLLFFFAGLNKFLRGAMSVVESFAERFQDTWLPLLLVKPYAFALPYVEILFGVLLIVGFRTRLLLFLTSLLLISLGFGQLILGDGDTVFRILTYAFITAFALSLSRYNRFSLDAYLCRK